MASLIRNYIITDILENGYLWINNMNVFQIDPVQLNCYGKWKIDKLENVMIYFFYKAFNFVPYERLLAELAAFRIIEVCTGLWFNIH